MACAGISRVGPGALDPWRFGTVGAPPEREVWPEPRRNGALVAAIGRILRGAFVPSRREYRQDM